jgi:cytochrome oxidase Cu insertion factor (SCO1/SenC/PrrC family)
MDRHRLDPFATSAFAGWLAITASWWALAFAPLPVPPEWLASARAVCFGSTPDGLPDTWGWMLLVLGPLSMLGFLAAVWGRELAGSARWLMARGAGVAALAALAVVPVTGAVLVGERLAASRGGGEAATTEEEHLPAAWPRGETPAPPFTLVDKHGAPVTLASFAGRPVIVGFAYAHCQTVCPVVVATVREAAGGLAGSTSVLLVTLDPWRDTPARLPALAEQWQLATLGDARVASGDVEAVEAMLAAWNVPAARDERTGEISHPALVYVVDGQGRLAYAFTNPPPRWIAEAVQRLDRES